MFYSVSKNTWFDPDFRTDYELSGQWPSDAKEFSLEIYHQTVSHRPADKVMVPDVNGDPVIVDKTLLFADLVVDKRKEISDACEAAILAGFESAALGDVHQYPSDRDDQLNLSGTIQRSQLPLAQPTDLYPFKCSLDGGAMVFRPHTAAQIQQVGADAYNAIVNARVKNAQRQAQIDAAESASDQKALDAVVW